jgi:hypothetical protein
MTPRNLFIPDMPERLIAARAFEGAGRKKL